MKLIFVVLEVNILLAKLRIQFRLELGHHGLDLFNLMLDGFDLVDFLLLGFLQQSLRLLEAVVDEDLADQELNLIVIHQLDLLDCLVDVRQLILLGSQVLFQVFDFCDVIGELIDVLLISEGDLHICIGILK